MAPTVDFVVDVGNTRVKWGRCSADAVETVASLKHEPEAWQRQLVAWKVEESHRWVIAGVRPTACEQLAKWLTERKQSVHQLTSMRDLPLRVAEEVSLRTGIDRLLDAVAVNALRPAGEPAAVVDAGTAVTVDYVDAHGVFQGGAIFPGLRLMAQVLHQHTALLPSIQVTQRTDPPAKSTEPALQAGLFHAVLGGIESALAVYRRAGPLTVYVTGGDGELLAPHMAGTVRFLPTLTLEGIRLAGRSSGFS